MTLLTLRAHSGAPLLLLCAAITVGCSEPPLDSACNGTCGGTVPSNGGTTSTLPANQGGTTRLDTSSTSDTELSGGNTNVAGNTNVVGNTNVGGNTNVVGNTNVAGSSSTGGTTAVAWNLVWSDEFNGPSVDTNVWSLVEGAANVNDELEYYTARKNSETGANAFIVDGALVIEAREEAYGGRKYTSAKLESRGTKEYQYGRFEARMKLPATAGLWSAFWLIGANYSQVGWPVCGEIDVVEGKGRLPAWMSSAIHRGPSATQDSVATQSYSLTSGNFHEDWHRFAVEWEAGQIRFFVDDTRILVVAKGSSTGSLWPFDHPFFLILNLAVGGIFDNGTVPPAGMAPDRLYVDYVRVYQRP